jgi:hypothetical protein
VNRSNYRIRHPSGVPGWEPAPGWGRPLPGWAPLIDHGPLPVRVAGSVARWWWPTLALAGFGAVVGFVLGHDHATPGLSTRGLLTITLAAAVVVLLTIHRTAGPSALARAVVEYAVVAVLAGLLVAWAGGVDRPPSNAIGSSAKPEAKQPSRAKPNLNAGEDRRPGALRIAGGVGRTITKAIRAVTGAVGWLVDLWRRADQQTKHPQRPPSTTTATPTGEAMPLSPAVVSTSTRRLM